LQPHALVAKRDAGAATPAKYFFVRLEPLHCAEALFDTNAIVSIVEKCGCEIVTKVM
jgi:hypothetical protein